MILEVMVLSCNKLWLVSKMDKTNPDLRRQSVLGVFCFLTCCPMETMCAIPGIPALPIPAHNVCYVKGTK